MKKLTHEQIEQDAGLLNIELKHLKKEIELKDNYIKYLEGRLKKYIKGVKIWEYYYT